LQLCIALKYGEGEKKAITLQLYGLDYITNLGSNGAENLYPESMISEAYE
jgi:hypothetical protein